MYRVSFEIKIHIFTDEFEYKITFLQNWYYPHVVYILFHIIVLPTMEIKGNSLSFFGLFYRALVSDFMFRRSFDL